MSILAFSNLSYSYDKKKNIFSNISAEMELGKIYAILGPSGCGKTTLLSLLGGLDSPTKGKILFNGEDITEKGFANHRRNHVSFIFQAYNLIDYMTPLENVKLTSKLPPEPVLEKMGLTKEEMKRNVLQLSGGQQQRVAIARTLASKAPVILQMNRRETSMKKLQCSLSKYWKIVYTRRTNVQSLSLIQMKLRKRQMLFFN